VVNWQARRLMMNDKRQTTKKLKVLLAMSGGVDSSVAAALLVRQGYDVTGAFIKNWSGTVNKSASPNARQSATDQRTSGPADLADGDCNWRSERRDAQRAAASLGIPFLTFDFEKQYRKLVVDELFRGYAAGETPNPDVLCNEYVKFGLFWDKAKKLGFGLMATGHYAKQRITYNVQRKTKTAHLYRGADPEKDQSYFLYRVKQEALAHTLFPIGGLKKIQVRALAKRFKLPVADKPDSQGICFIGKVDFGRFLAKKIKPKPGDIVDHAGKVIGRHQGLHNYTVGQRQKINVADDHAWFVAIKDLKDNRLVVVPSEDHAWLKTQELTLGEEHWLLNKSPKTSSKVLVQVRYRQKPVRGVLRITKHEVKITLQTPIHAAAVGQSAVVYKGTECLGGGIIR
jgi:tRNA-specific 2-thiouridylase